MAEAVAQKSIQENVSITLFGVMAALGVLSFIVLSEVVAPAFDELERAEAETNLSRAEHAITSDLENLSAITGDWGLWDDNYDYVTGAYPEFRDSNLDRPTLENLDLAMLAIYDAEDILVWGQADDGERAVGLEVLQILDPGTRSARFLLGHDDPDGQIDGLFSTGLGPMLISSWPIVRSDGTGPIGGTMIMGQLLNDERLIRLRDRTEVMLDWQPVTDGLPQEIFDAPLNRGGTAAMMHEELGNAIVSRGLLVDLFDQPLLVLEASTPRQISALGQSTVNGAMLFLAIAGVITAVVAWFLLRNLIILPLGGLARHITGIRKSGDLSHRIGGQRDDEIGALADEFDKLTAELEETRRALLDQSFKAGKADTAAEVLHNIRNAMTPLINSVDRLGKDLQTADGLKVRQAIEELRDDDCPPERGDKLLLYIDSAFAYVEGRNEDMTKNVDVASKQARQVEAILLDQEKYANVSPVLETLQLGEVLDEAVLVLPESAGDAIELDVVDGVGTCSVRGHRVGLLQVISNLILNAYEAITRSQSQTGRIELTAVTEAVDDESMVRLTVRDTGCGFDDDTRAQIFKRGFSSKRGHMSGLGLHWCANALAGMGGRIQAYSAGPGRGAEFHVLLPAVHGG